MSSLFGPGSYIAIVPSTAYSYGPSYYLPLLLATTRFVFLASHTTIADFFRLPVFHGAGHHLYTHSLQQWKAVTSQKAYPLAKRIPTTTTSILSHPILSHPTHHSNNNHLNNNNNNPFPSSNNSLNIPPKSVSQTHTAFLPVLGCKHHQTKGSMACHLRLDQLNTLLRTARM